MQITQNNNANQLHVPPNSLEIEQSVLNLLIQRQALDIEEYAFSEEDFYYPSNKYIFGAMVALRNNELPIDYATLVDRLSHTQSGFDYEEYLYTISTQIIAGTISQYALLLKNITSMRNLLSAIKSVENYIYARSKSESEIVAQAEKMIFEISSKLQTRDHLRHIKQINQIAKTQIEARAQRGDEIEFETGYADLDAMTNGLHPGELIVIAGRPSMGKTSLAMNIAEHLATIKDKGVVVFSMEMSAEALALRLFSAVGKIAMNHLRDGKLTNEDWMKLTSAISELDKTDIIIDNSANMSPAEIRTRTRKATRLMSRPLGCIVIDYIQLMRGDRQNDNRVQEISEISRALKGLAMELQVPVVALSQLNRAVENRDNKRPRMSDLRESGAIEQDADIVLFIYRDEVYNKTTEDKGVAELHIAKHRNGEVGMVKLHFFGQWSRFENHISQERLSPLTHTAFTAEASSEGLAEWNN